MGKDISGCEVVKNYDLGAGPIHVAWIFKPGSESLPDLRLGLICITEFSNQSINEAIARAMLNIIDKLVLLCLLNNDQAGKRCHRVVESLKEPVINRITYF
jgi:hypothetical protein